MEVQSGEGGRFQKISLIRLNQNLYSSDSSKKADISSPMPASRWRILTSERFSLEALATNQLIPRHSLGDGQPLMLALMSRSSSIDAADALLSVIGEAWTTIFRPSVSLQRTFSRLGEQGNERRIFLNAALITGGGSSTVTSEHSLHDARQLPVAEGLVIRNVAQVQ